MIAFFGAVFFDIALFAFSGDTMPAFASVGLFPLSSLVNATVAAAPSGVSFGAVAAVLPPSAFSIAAAPVAVDLEE